jgi:DNA-binding SARP family transcriptional activator
MENLARGGAFAKRTAAGGFVVQPIVAQLLLEGEEARRDALLERAAEASAACGDLLRATELYLALGDREAAAEALGSIEIFDRGPEQRYVRALAALDRGLIARHPRLWGASVLLRSFTVATTVLRDEAESIWRTLPPGLEAIERFYVFAARTFLMTAGGDYDGALAAIAPAIEAMEDTDRPRDVFEGFALFVRGAVRARRGAFALGERDLRAALPAIERMPIAVWMAYATFGGLIARSRGEWEIERQFLFRAREYAERVGTQQFLAAQLAEELCGAWLSGDGRGFERTALELEAVVLRGGAGGFAYLAGTARGRDDIEVRPADIPRFVVVAHFIRIARERDEGRRSALAHEALRIARIQQIPLLEVLAATALALCESDAFDSAMHQASASASRCESQPLVDAVAAVAAEREDRGMLRPFVAHIKRERGDAPIALDVLAGRVRIDGRPVRLPAREFELLAAIAEQRQPSARMDLAAKLWPELDEESARNAFSVCLHRLRAHLKRDDAIEYAGGGYRLHADAFVDCWEIERAAASARDGTSVARALARLREPRMRRIERWEWFEQRLRRFDALKTELAHRVARDTLARGDIEAALACAQGCLDDDACDETACEIAIRAHLARGDRAGALRCYRRYCDALRDELQAEPSGAIAAMLEEL